MIILEVLSVLARIFLMVGFGYLLNRMGVIKTEDEELLTDILFKGVLPLSIIAASATDTGGQSKKEIFLLLIIFIGVYAMATGIGLGLGKILKLSYDKRMIFAAVVTFANTGFIGFPVMQELYGDIGLLYAVTVNLAHNVFVYTVGLRLFDEEAKGSIKTLLRNNLTVGALIMLVLFFGGIKLPSIIQETFSAIGKMVTPMSMMIIGSSIAGKDIKRLVTDKYSYIGAAMRLLVVPIIVFIIMKIVRAPEMIKITCTIMSGLPCGATTAIMARKYHREETYATLTSILTIILFAFTLPVLLLLLKL